MTTAKRAYAVEVGLTCALALMAVTQLSVNAPTGAEGGMIVSQYCAPPEDNTDTQRLYCRYEGG